MTTGVVCSCGGEFSRKWGQYLIGGVTGGRASRLVLLLPSISHQEFHQCDASHPGCAASPQQGDLPLHPDAPTRAGPTGSRTRDNAVGAKAAVSRRHTPVSSAFTANTPFLLLTHTPARPLCLLFPWQPADSIRSILMKLSEEHRE